MHLRILIFYLSVEFAFSVAYVFQDIISIIKLHSLFYSDMPKFIIYTEILMHIIILIVCTVIFNILFKFVKAVMHCIVLYPFNLIPI